MPKAVEQWVQQLLWNNGCSSYLWVLAPVLHLVPSQEMDVDLEVDVDLGMAIYRI